MKNGKRFKQRDSTHVVHPKRDHHLTAEELAFDKKICKTVETNNFFVIKGFETDVESIEELTLSKIESKNEKSNQKNRKQVKFRHMAKYGKRNVTIKKCNDTVRNKNDPTKHQDITIRKQNETEQPSTVGNSQVIVNLSSHALTDPQKSILTKGLKFCPTQKRNDPAESRVDLEVFHKKLRTKEFFSKQNQNQNQKGSENSLNKISPYGNTANFLKLRQKSNWKPPHGSPNLETFINVNEMDLSNDQPSRNKKQNISEEERLAIKQLSKNNEITIKPADKGGAIVIMNTLDYIKEADRQLSDSNTYKKASIDLTNQHQNEVDLILDKMVIDKDITEKMAKFLKNKTPRTPQIYFLPKIHKNKIPPPGRPIVSANGCPTEKISAFVDHFLNPLVKEMDSYIEDTSDFLRQISNLETITKNGIIGTMDVSSLYTNIPNKEGTESISELLTRKRNKLEKPSNESLVELLRMVLTKNNFQFNGTNYLQIGGTAMGTKVAPSLANLFMEKLEKEMTQSYYLKPKIWYRYIDDIFYIWEHGEDELEKWITHLNQYHPTIKFTNEWSNKEICFLDTKVKVDQKGKLYTDLYVKPTDTNSYLNYNSAHPPTCKNSLPYSQLLRIKRICTKSNDFDKHAKTKINEFKIKNYPEKILQEALAKVESLNRNELIKKKEKQNRNPQEENTFLTCTFRPNYQKVPKLVKKNWDILARSATTKNLHRTHLKIGYRRPKNLKEMLVKARTNYHPETDKSPSNKCCEGRNKCKKKSCLYCKNLDIGGSIINSNEKITCKQAITCNSSNVIYCIECTCCRKKYIGQIKRRIKDRMREHFYSVKKQKESDVAYHFNSKGHNGVSDMKFYIVDFIYKHPES